MKTPTIHIVLFVCLSLLSTAPALFSQSDVSSLETKAEEASKNGFPDQEIQHLNEALNLSTKSNEYDDQLRLLNKVAHFYMHQFKTDSAKMYYRKAANLALRNKDSLAYGIALNSLIPIYNFQSRPDSMERLVQEVLKIKEMPYNFISDAYTSLSNIRVSELKFEEAEQLLLKAIRIDSMYRDSSSIPFNLVALSEYESRKLNHEKALQLLFKAETYLRGSQDKFKYASIYTEIARVFISLNNLRMSRNYCQKALVICDDLNLQITRINPLIILATIEEKHGNFEKALELYQQAEKISRSKNKMSAKVEIDIGMASCLLELGNYSKAKQLLDQVASELDDLKNKNLEIKYRFARVKHLLYTNAPGALNFAKKMYDEIATSENIYMKHQLTSIISRAFLEQNQYRESIRFDRIKDKLHDSIYKIEQNNYTQELEAEFRQKEMNNQISLLAAENKLKSTELNQQYTLNRLAIVALVIFLVLFFTIIMFYRSLKSSKQLIEKSLQDKSYLLREIHHRVKNNLQVISSMLALQSRYIKDQQAIDSLQDSQNRVHSMALIHEDLYRSEDISGVDTELYFEQLVDNLVDSYLVDEGKVNVEIKVTPMRLDVETMIPLGLILNELVSNAFKHAFKKQDHGTISIRLEEQEDKLLLTVKDNGKSLQSTEELKNKSFGYELIQAFAHKLEAEMIIYLQEGLCVKLAISNYNKLNNPK